MPRRKPPEAGMNLDSLLDTLTNVVGVLVMVLMLTTLNVQSAVQRVMDLDPTQIAVSEADLQKTRKQAEDAKKAREALASQATSTATAGPNDDFGALLRKLDELKATKIESNLTPEQIAELAKKADESAKKAQETSLRFVKLEEELQQLKSKLDTTEVVAAPPPKTVSLPNPREAPKDATQYRVIVRDGRVTPFNPNPVRDRCKKQVEFLLKSPALKNKAGEVDCDKLVEQFNRGANVADADFKTRLIVENFNLVIVFELRPTGGESAKTVAGSNSEFRRGLKALQKKHGEKFYLRFLVWSDSFDAYVEARRACDELEVAAGWEPYNEDFIWKEGLGMAVACQGKPPPPPPPKNPPPSTPAGPPPMPIPNDVVD